MFRITILLFLLMGAFSISTPKTLQLSGNDWEIIVIPNNDNEEFCNDLDIFYRTREYSGRLGAAF